MIDYISKIIDIISAGNFNNGQQDPTTIFQTVVKNVVKNINFLISDIDKYKFSVQNLWICNFTYLINCHVVFFSASI